MGSIILVLFAQGLNVAFLVTLAFAVAASANVPTILLTIFWSKFNTTGAVAGILVGLVSTVVLVALSPSVLTGAETGPTAIIPVDAVFPFKNPALFSVPLGLLACVIGTLLGGRGTEREQEQGIHTDYDEIYVSSLTGISLNIDQELQEATRRLPGH